MASHAPAPASGSRRRRRPRAESAILGIVGLAAFVAIWELAARLGPIDAAFFPPFTTVIAAVGDLLVGALSADFWGALGMTLVGWAAGLAIALVLGVVAGLALGASKIVRDFTHSTVEFLRPIPSVGLIPIAVVIFGVRPTATVAVVAWACFWVILVHVIAGVADVDPVGDETARSYGFGWYARVRHVMWPTLLPYLMTGLRLSGTIALVVAVTIEIVVGAPGIGQLIALHQSAGNAPVVYGLALLAGVVGLVINLALRRAETSLLSWHSSVRAERAARDAAPAGPGVGGGARAGSRARAGAVTGTGSRTEAGAVGR
ncbi:MAG: ABC transporter permease [Pseudoclavibacter sp.]